MALLCKCRKCRRRVPLGSKSCPCGSASLRLIIDYWPRGRSGGRKQITLPEGTTVKKAQLLAKEYGRAKRKAIAVPHQMTVADLFPEYLRWYRQHRAVTTWHDVSGAWERDLKRLMGGYLVTDIEASHYSLYQQMRGKVSPRTINKELDYFSGFLRFLRREKKIDIPRVEYEKLPYHKPIPIVLSPDEVLRILSAAESEPVYHALILCLYTLGLRISAARGIKVEDIDFENRAVRVLQKGGAWKLLPVSDHLLESVERVLQSRQEKVKTGKGWKATPHVFSVEKDGRPVQNVRKALARICKRAGVVKWVHPHLFRHTLITHMIAAGIPTRTAQDYADHRQITTTEGYSHIAMENLRAAQDRAVSTRKPNENGNDLAQPEYNI